MVHRNVRYLWLWLLARELLYWSETGCSIFSTGLEDYWPCSSHKGQAWDQPLLQRYSEVFGESLATMHNFTAKLQV